MAKPIVSHRKAQKFSTAFLLLGMAVLALMDSFWPGLMLVLGLAFAMRQFLLGKVYDAVIALGVFGGIFFAAFMDVPLKVLLTVLFVVAAIYILFRDYWETEVLTEEEKEVDTEHEIEDSSNK